MNARIISAAVLAIVLFPMVGLAQDSMGTGAVETVRVEPVMESELEVRAFETIPVTPDTEVVSPPTEAVIKPVITSVPTRGTLYQTSNEAKVTAPVVPPTEEVTGTSYLDQDDDEDSVPSKLEDLSMSQAIVVSKVTVRGWDVQKKEEFFASAPTRPEEVTDVVALEKFATRAVMQDDWLESVAFEEEKVVVEVASRGKLFWVIPVSFTQTIEVDSRPDVVLAERVKVRMPWYSFLVAKDDAARGIAVATTESMGKDHEKWTDISSVSLRARLFGTVADVLKTKHDTAKNSVGNVR